MMRKPNILWITTDQQRFDTLGCTGNVFTQTPHIDALAKRGIFYKYAYAQSPICSPSRASFMTGRYPRTTRCRGNGQSIPPDEKLVTKILSDAGYRCGMSGKLHLAPASPTHLVGTPKGVQEKRTDDGYLDEYFHWAHWPGCAETEYQRDLKGKGVAIPEPYHDEKKGGNFEHCRYVSCPLEQENDHTTWCVDKAIDFIEAGQGDAPWFFSLNLVAPHHPFVVDRKLLERYQPMLDKIPLPRFQKNQLAQKTSVQRNDHGNAYNQLGYYAYENMTDEDHRWIRAAYWAMVDLIDIQIGRLLKRLETTEQKENTVIIFTSDHGEMLGNHGIYFKGPYFYEDLVHVPLIIAGPGVEPGKDDRLVELLDIAPTLLEMAGEKASPGMQGHSLLSTVERNDVYSEYYNAMPFHKKPNAFATMLRTRDYKIVHLHSHYEGELYDLRKDPLEQENLWNHPGSKELKIEMLTKLSSRMAWTSDPLPEREAWT